MYSSQTDESKCDGAIAILTVTSPIVMNAPTRYLLAVEKNVLLFCVWQNLNNLRIVCKQCMNIAIEQDPVLHQFAGLIVRELI